MALSRLIKSRSISVFVLLFGAIFWTTAASEFSQPVCFDNEPKALKVVPADIGALFEKVFTEREYWPQWPLQVDSVKYAGPEDTALFYAINCQAKYPAYVLEVDAKRTILNVKKACCEGNNLVDGKCGGGRQALILTSFTGKTSVYEMGIRHEQSGIIEPHDCHPYASTATTSTATTSTATTDPKHRR